MRSYARIGKKGLCREKLIKPRKNEDMQGYETIWKEKLKFLWYAMEGFTVQNEKSQIVLNTSINSISCVPFSILPMIYQYFWRVRLAKPE